MNCKTIQDLILTDYSDGRMPAQRRQELEAHLNICGHCRHLAKQAHKQAIAPFERTTPAVPDEFLWLQIKRKVQQEQSVESAPVGALELAGQFLSLRRWAIAAPLVAMLVVIPLLYFGHMQKPSYVAYIMESDSPNNEVTQGIEQYFL